MSRRSVASSAPWLFLGLGLAGVAMFARWHNRDGKAIALTAPACVGNLNSNVYSSTGLVNGDFSSITAVDFPSTPSRGAARLNTNLTPLDTNNITLPFEQRVKVKYVYRNAGAQHSLGWFYLDGMGPKGAANSFLTTTGGLADRDGDGLYDWFQGDAAGARQKTGLWRRDSSSNLRLTYSTPDDGGTWGSIPNALETLMTAGGGWIFKLCDDDSGLGANYAWMIQDDDKDNNDGIPDYDVDGDGTVGDADDRTVDLGILSGNRELVLFFLTYYGQNLPKAGVGETGTGTRTSQITPLFTKNDLNPDLASQTPNSTLRNLAIGCSRDDSACYTPKGGNLGWMDNSAITRLNTATYNFLSLAGDNTVKQIKASALGQVPHFVVTAPATDPNRWIIGMEDLAGGGDMDWNDVVVVLEKSNGGEAVSNEIANIPDADKAETMISKIRVTATFTFPSPGCNAPVVAAVKVFYSVDNKTTWREVTFAASTGGDTVVDVLGKGDVGSTLHWKVQFTSSSDLCQPKVDSFSLGWEAIKHGQYKYNAPIPNGNVLFSGTVETPSKTWTVTNLDYSLRGHFIATRLYDPTNLSQDGTLQLWDGGAVLAARNPDTRNLFTASTTGTKILFTTANSANLYPRLLDTTARAELLNGQKVFDYDSDGDSDDNDAQLLLQWVRGWELGATGVQRAWKLGPIHYSSAAIIGPPANPAWYEGSGAPAATKTLYNTFRNANTTRRSLGIAGGQDGMVHAFDAGAFRWGQATDCAVKLERGCYAQKPDNSGLDYGDGSEQWAFIPPSQLDNLKSNPPKARNFLPDTYLDADVDGGISAEDVLVGGAFYTGIFISGGRKQPYLSALKLPSGSTVAEPMWAADFVDSDYKGTDFSPAVAMAELSSGAKFVAVVSSGLGLSATPPYLYVLDAALGTTLSGGKVRLTQPTGDPDTLGVAGYPNLIDTNGNGLVDRVYTVDTSGRVFKLDLTTMVRCQVAALGETVFTGMATEVTGAGSGNQKVHLYVGGSPNPDGTNPPASGTVYHIKAIEDDDPVGTCTVNGGAVLYTKTLGTAEKMWATPYVAGTNVFFASSGADSLGICAVGSGTLYGYDTDDTSGTQPVSTVASVNLLGSPVSSIRIFDAHVFVNTVGGKTVQVGASGWNNTNSSQTSAGVSALKTLLWLEY